MALEEAASAYRRIEGFVQRAGELLREPVDPSAAVPERFANAMDDDLGVPQALAVLHDTVREGNTALAAGDAAAGAPRSPTSARCSWSSVSTLSTRSGPPRPRPAAATCVSSSTRS